MTLFSPEQARRVLVRVAELQGSTPRAIGMTRAELDQIAVDAGLDSSLVDQAIAETTHEQVVVEAKAGSTVAVTCELSRWLSETEVVDFTSRLAHELGGAGELSNFADGWKWVTRTPSGATVLSIRRVMGGSLVRLEQASAATAHWFVGFLAGLVAAATAGALVKGWDWSDPAVLASVLTAWIGVTFAIGWPLTLRSRALCAETLRGVLLGALRHLPVGRATLPMPSTAPALLPATSA